MSRKSLVKGLDPVHPGEILREDVLPSLEMPVSTAAKHLGVTRQQLHRILAGTASITPEMALRLGKFCGNGPDLWLRMQQRHDLWRAERLLDKLETATDRGFALSPASVEAIGRAETRRAGWLALALWVIAIALVLFLVRVW